MEKEIISIELDPINDGLTGMPGSVESNASRFFVMGTNFEHRAISDSEYFGYIEQMGENGVTLIRGDYLIIYDARKSFTACDEDYLIGSFLLAKPSCRGCNCMFERMDEYDMEAFHEDLCDSFDDITVNGQTYSALILD